MDKNNLSNVNQVDWDSWQYTEEAVLCFVKDGSRLMLIHKKTGLGAGKVNAPGGRVEPGESNLHAAIRETQEETHVVADQLTLKGELNFIFVDGYSLRGWVYIATAYTGTPLSTREADPFWCEIDAIPYHHMWADDIHWLPRILAGEDVRGQFIFDGDQMLSHRVFSTTFS